ncbi:MAG: sulfatase-like hydrolase/transferase [Tunicatimonas sp.]
MNHNHRRSLLWIALPLIILFAHCTRPEPPAEPVPSDAIRNVVVIIGDDHATSVLGAYGNELIRTPNLDQLASQGTTFLHAYANSPVCTPSRQSLLTGRYPHAAGVTLLRTALSDEQVTLAEHLKQQGYRTGVVGKTHFNSNLSHGFDTLVQRADYRTFRNALPPRPLPDSIRTRKLPWRPFQDPARVWLNADARPDTTYDSESEGTFLANQAASFIQDNQDTSFLLWVGFFEPHSPFNFPIEYANKYSPDDIVLPETSDEDDRWVPEIFRGLSEADQRGVVAAYYNSVEYLDKNVGIVLGALQAAGLDENTLVIYLGDHGYLLGDHRRFEKHMMWEEAVRAPLIMRAGNRFAPGQRTEALAEFVDVVPTITELLNVPPLPTAQGHSAVPVLAKPDTSFRDHVFSEFLVDNKAMIRDREWKYIFTSGKRDLGQGYATGFGPSGVSERLYNQENDPGEATNVADRSENQVVLEKMRQEMLTLFRETHPKADQMPKDLSVEEQLAWFCEPVEDDADYGE